MGEISRIGIVGSGNVASALGREFQLQNIEISWILSTNEVSGSKLANSLACDFIVEYSQATSVDCVIIAVPDDSIEECLAQISADQSVAYTSGLVQLNQLHDSRLNLGVFYPLQTFSAGRNVNIFNVPFFIEARNTEFASTLLNLAWKISSKVEFANSDQRMKMHVAAVFVNNFVNLMFTEAEQLTHAYELKWEHFEPLIEETFAKIKTLSPKEAQTGPARRGDLQTINAHEHLLHGTTLDIYKLLTQRIQELYGKTKL